MNYRKRKSSHVVFLIALLFLGACTGQTKTKEGQPMSSDKLLPMEGGYNIRDLGGIETADGRCVKSGLIFRGDELGGLTAKDWEFLSEIPIVTVVDFRSNEEVEANPDNLPESVHNQVFLPISPGNLTMEDMSFLESPEFDGEQFMKDLNVELVSDSASIKQYREFFRLLQHEDCIPLIFHCTAGKDRTGMGAALYLSALGVDEESIFENYLESNKNLEKKYADLIADNPKLAGMMGVKREYLESGLNYIKSTYGSIENYLETVLDVDIALMRQMYL